MQKKKKTKILHLLFSVSAFALTYFGFDLLLWSSFLSRVAGNLFVPVLNMSNALWWQIKMEFTKIQTNFIFGFVFRHWIAIVNSRFIWMENECVLAMKSIYRNRREKNNINKTSAQSIGLLRFKLFRQSWILHRIWLFRRLNIKDQWTLLKNSQCQSKKRIWEWKERDSF